jgi:hypothetical protein
MRAKDKGRPIIRPVLREFSGLIEWRRLKRSLFLERTIRIREWLQPGH